MFFYFSIDTVYISKANLHLVFSPACSFFVISSVLKNVRFMWKLHGSPTLNKSIYLSIYLSKENVFENRCISQNIYLNVKSKIYTTYIIASDWSQTTCADTHNNMQSTTCPDLLLEF